MTTAIVTLSSKGLIIARALNACFSNAKIYVHQSVHWEEEERDDSPTFAKGAGGVSSETAPAVVWQAPCPSFSKGEVRTFDRIVDLTSALFKTCTGIVYIAPCGAVVRAMAPYIDHKTRDPAVVVVDAGGRHAISLLSGHEGGANALAIVVANAIGAEPVISTTTEAAKDIIVGIGCRKNTPGEDLIEAIQNSLAEMILPLEAVRLLATADIKRDEVGLLEAANALEVPLLFVPSEEIRAFGGAFEISVAAQKNLSLPAVAEPACMLAGKRTSLIMRKKKCNGITIAMARESCLWSA